MAIANAVRGFGVVTRRSLLAVTIPTRRLAIDVPVRVAGPTASVLIPVLTVSLGKPAFREPFSE
jgi:hypothetical protein